MFKDSFFSGLKTILPIILFIIILSWVIGTLFSGIEFIESLFPDSVLDKIGLPDIMIKLVGLLLFCIIVWIIGTISKRPRMSKKFKSWLDPIITRIPLLSHLYSITNQVATKIQKTESFKKVVFVPWPSDKMWVIGFITNENPPSRYFFPEPENMISVALMPAPFTSSWPGIVNRRYIIETDIPVSEAVSYILSLGAAGATEKLREKYYPTERSHSGSEWDFF